MQYFCISTWALLEWYAECCALLNPSTHCCETRATRAKCLVFRRRSTQRTWWAVHRNTSNQEYADNILLAIKKWNLKTNTQAMVVRWSRALGFDIALVSRKENRSLSSSCYGMRYDDFEKWKQNRENTSKRKSSYEQTRNKKGSIFTILVLASR